MASTVTDAQPEIVVTSSSASRPDQGSTALSSVANPRRVRLHSLT